MANRRLEMSEIFRQAFTTGPGIARLLLVVVLALGIGLLLAITEAPSWLKTIAILLGGIIAATFLFVPIYRQWLRGQSEKDAT